MEAGITDISPPRSISEVTGTSAPGAISSNKEQYLQKPLATGAAAAWQVPQVRRYEQSNAENTSRAARVHALAMNRIEKHWNKNVASNCLPPELEKVTPYSLALLTRLDILANLTRHDHGHGVKLLLEAIERRRARDATSKGPTLAEDVRTIPARVGTQPKAKVVEAEIWENRSGIMLADVDRAVQEALKPAEMARNARPTTESTKTCIEQQHRKTTQNLASIVREVVGLDLPRYEEFTEIERRLGHDLQRAQRRAVTKIRKTLSSSSHTRISYSTAASGPHGDIITVKGLISSLSKLDIAEQPGLSDEGKKFLEANEISTASLEESARTRDFDRNAAQDAAESSGSCFTTSHDGDALGTAMENAGI